jgi:hypothetical protein
MPWIIDYPLVLDQMRSQNLKCLYCNSGAFGYPDLVKTQVVGWIGPADSTIRPEMLPLAHRVPEPHVENLMSLAAKAWAELFPGRAWVMPASHWAYEIDFGSGEWMPALLERVGIDPGLLARRNNAAAIEFAADETEPFKLLVERLLQMLRGSDFTIAFPNWPALCRLHHHQQLWWMTTGDDIASALRGLAFADTRRDG